MTIELSEEQREEAVKAEREKAKAAIESERQKAKSEKDKALKQGEKNGKIEIAKNLLKRSLPLTEISDLTGLAIVDIERLR